MKGKVRVSRELCVNLDLSDFYKCTDGQNLQSCRSNECRSLEFVIMIICEPITIGSYCTMYRGPQLFFNKNYWRPKLLNAIYES